MGLYSSFKSKRAFTLGLGLLIFVGCDQPTKPIYNGEVRIYRGDGNVTAVTIVFPERQTVCTKEQIEVLLGVLDAMKSDLEHAQSQVGEAMPDRLPKEPTEN